MGNKETKITLLRIFEIRVFCFRFKIGCLSCGATKEIGDINEFAFTKSLVYIIL